MTEGQMSKVFLPQSYGDKDRRGRFHRQANSTLRIQKTVSRVEAAVM